jgi:hypothetical protein
MFHLAGFRLWLTPDLLAQGLLHSDIFGSTRVCHSPKRFVAYYVLHRLLVPRYSRCAHLHFFTKISLHVDIKELPLLPTFMGLTRFELVTLRLSSACSNQLSYRPNAARGREKKPNESIHQFRPTEDLPSNRSGHLAAVLVTP